jgi:hypothetical protein
MQIAGAMMSLLHGRSAAFGVVAILGFGVFSSLYAQSNYFMEYNKTIARLGAQGTGYYVGFAEPLGQNCAWGIVFVASDRKGLYTQLLAAKLAGKHIGRFDYSQPGGNGTQCNAELVEFSE